MAVGVDVKSLIVEVKVDIVLEGVIVVVEVLVGPILRYKISK